MEDLFFKEGDELSTPPPFDDDPDEITELVPRPRSRRKLAVGIAVTTTALVVLALLIF